METLQDDWDLFFAPKVEVAHVFKCTTSDRLVTSITKSEAIRMRNNSTYTYLGTITGPIVPPEKSEVVK